MAADASSPQPPEYHWALGVEYNGQAFHGWQRQKDASSVQQSLEEALSRVADQPIRVAAAGRTDAGVHATAQVASFTTTAQRPDRAWQLGVNSHLPAGVSISWVRQTPADFHARFSALARRYLYVFAAERVPSALGGGQWWSGPSLDVASMHQAAQALLGEQDFSAVRAAGCQSPTAWRCVHRVSVTSFGRLTVLDIEANAFLLHMVRNIASMLQQVGVGARGVDWPAKLLRAGDRRELGPTGPPQGLYLAAVRYDPALELPGLQLPPPLRALSGPAALI